MREAGRLLALFISTLIFAAVSLIGIPVHVLLVIFFKKTKILGS